MQTGSSRTTRGLQRLLALLALPVALAVITALPVVAAEGEVSLEEEMRFLEAEWTVESASLYAQSISEAAAAVTVVKDEQIWRYGYRNIDDILRSLSGFYVTNDRNYSYLGVRGFGLPADYNSRTLLLRDGHRLNEPIYGSALYGWESGIAVDGIDSLEAVRGPASALYGTNAMFGTLSVNSKTPLDFPGNEVHLTLSEPGLVSAVGRTRGISGRTSYSLELRGLYRDGHDELFFPEFAGADFNEDGTVDSDGIARDADGADSYGILASASRGSLTLTGSFYNFDKTVPTGAFETVFDTDETTTTERRGYLDLLHNGEVSENLSVTGRATLDYYFFDGDYAYPFEYDYERLDFEEQPFTIARDEGDAWWVGGELRGDYSGISRNRIILGGSLHYTWATQKTYDKEPRYVYQDQEFDFYDLSLFLQDDITLTDWAHLILGVNYSHYDEDIYEGDASRANPRAGLVVNAGSSVTLKALYGEAFRVPNLYELFYTDDGETQIPNPELDPEVMRTAEFILEADLPAAFKARVSLYNNWIEDLIQAVEVDEEFGVIQFQNIPNDVVSRGFELDLRRSLAAGISGYVALSLQKTENDETDEELPNSPEQTLKAGLSIPLQQDKTFLSLEGRYVGERRTVDLENEVDSYTVLNATIANRGLVKNLSMSFSVYNILDEEYSDPASFDHSLQEIPQDGRTFSAQATYSF